jgi:hypothetical protein
VDIHEEKDYPRLVKWLDGYVHCAEVPEGALEDILGCSAKSQYQIGSLHDGIMINIH